VDNWRSTRRRSRGYNGNCPTQPLRHHPHHYHYDAHHYHVTTQTTTPQPPQATPKGGLAASVNSKNTRAVVPYAAPTKFKPGQMQRLIEDNRGHRVEGIYWLLGEDRRTGKLASSLVIYLSSDTDPNQGLRIGRRVFQTTEYDWSR